MPPSASKVFVIDDDDGVRLGLSRALSRRGFDTSTFESASAFLDVYDQSQTGCIILDQDMPEMTGLELQKQLVDLDCSIPIIFISGHCNQEVYEQAMSAGAVDFLEKPFRHCALVEALTAALGSNAVA